jgi:hypothetical protein
MNARLSAWTRTRDSSPAKIILECMPDYKEKSAYNVPLLSSF